MKQYVLWGQVQRRLTEHLAEAGAPYSFYDAVRELWDAGEFQSAPELPLVSFEEWDADDLDQLGHLIGQTPVDLDVFTPGFRHARSSQEIIRHIQRDQVPIFIAQDQAMGMHAHDAFDLLYVLRGEAILHCGQNQYTLPTGTLCLLAPRTLHDTIAGDGCLLLSLSLAEKMWKILCSSYCGSRMYWQTSSGPAWGANGGAT